MPEPTAVATETSIPPALPITATQPPMPTTEPSPTPTEKPQGPTGWIAFIGSDSNLWLVDASSGEKRQLTQDGVTWDASNPGQILNQQTAGYVWKPGAYLLVYGRMIDRAGCPQGGRPLVGPRWPPDGKWLVLNSAPYENRQIVVVSTKDGSTKTVANGIQPTWQLGER